MTIVGRSQIDHPAFNTTGGTGLHASIETIYTNIGNDLGARYDTAVSIANSAVTVIDHNFGIPFADLKINLYTGSHPNLVRVADPTASGWVIAATSGFLKTKIDVTAPASGGPHTFAVLTMQSRGSEKLKDLDDINFAVAPIDGQFLIYDTATSKWLPAYLKYKSETATIVSNAITPTTGTNVQRITGASADLQMIASPIASKVYVLINDTGSDILVKNDTGATAANRFYTGTGNDITLKNQAAVTAIYNSGTSRWVLSGGSGGGGLATELRSALFTAAAGKHYLVDNAASAFTATLPAGSTGTVIRFSDNSRVWASRNLTIAPASGETIDGLAANETLVCDVSGAFVQLMWNGTKWIVDTNGFAASISSGTLSGGQGLGKKNYIGNPNNATNWITGGATVTVTTETSSANLPDQITQTTAIAITRVSGTTGYAAFRFELDRSDYSKKFEINIDQKSAFTTEGYQVQAFAGSVFGTYGTQLTVQTAALTALTGSFITTVDMPGSATPFIEFRIVATGSAGTAPFYANNVYFGPGVTSQGAAISEWATFTPTFSNVTVSNNGSFWRRSGSEIEIKVDVSATADATSTVFWNMNGGLTGITPDTLKFASRQAFGSGVVLASTSNYLVSPSYNGSTCRFALDGSANLDTVNPVGDGGFDNTDRLTFEVSYPVSEWASSGTVNLGAGAQIENVSNNGSTATAGGVNTTANSVAGSAGSSILAIASTTAGNTTNFQCTLQYPLQVDDLLLLEINSGFGWSASDLLFPYVAQGASQYGMTVLPDSATQVTVYFGNKGAKPNNVSYAGDGQTWSTYSAYKWRVRKCKASSPVGFGLITYDASGLQRSYNSLARIRLHTGNGYGSTNTMIRRYTTAVLNTGSGLTYADSATLGASFTCTEAGLYSFHYSEIFGVAGNFGLSLNSTQLTTNISGITAADRLTIGTTPAASYNSFVSTTILLAVGDVVRPHADSTAESIAPARASFAAIRIS